MSQLLAPAGAWEEQLELLAAFGWVRLWPGGASAVQGLRTTRSLVLLERQPLEVIVRVWGVLMSSVLV